MKVKFSRTLQVNGNPPMAKHVWFGCFSGSFCQNDLNLFEISVAKIVNKFALTHWGDAYMRQ